MNLKTFTVRTPNGIRMINNIDIEKRLVYKNDLFTIENRIEVLKSRNFFDNPKYTIENDYRKVYAYFLVTEVNEKYKELMPLQSREEGVRFLDKIFEALSNPKAKSRVIDLTESTLWTQV